MSNQITDVSAANFPVLLSTKQAASLLGTSEKFIRDQCARGEFQAAKLGGIWRLNRDSLLAQCGLV